MNFSVENLRNEEARMRRLRLVVDLSLAVPMQAGLTCYEASGVVQAARRAGLALIPHKGEVCDLNHLPRFRRVISVRFAASGGKLS